MENCLRALVDIAKNRGIVIPNELETQVLNMFQKQNLLSKNTRVWLSSTRRHYNYEHYGHHHHQKYANTPNKGNNTIHPFAAYANYRNDRSIIDAFQDIVTLLEEQLRPLVLAELSVLVDVFYKPETLFPTNSSAKKMCNNGGFICKLIKHTEKLMEEKDERLCIKVLQTLKEMMDVDPHFDDRVSLDLVD